MANIAEFLKKIMNAIYGREVRVSIHDAIDAINKEVESTTTRQDHLEKVHEQLIINAGNSNAEVVDARIDKTTGVTYSTLGKRLDDFSLKMKRIVINVDDYSGLVVSHNGVDTWDRAFEQAFNDLKNGGILLIPNGDYYIKQRVKLENKDGITILCGGVIKPVDGEIPLIGTLTLNNLTNSTINSLKFDGNKDNITPPTAVGMESLIEMNDCSNITFNNFSAENVSSVVVNSNGGLKNIIFNNVYIKNIGEHGFYFGGNGASNIRFNNFYCENIGVSTLNATRSVACIKFRNKVNTDTLHDQIIIDGFKFVMNTAPITTYDRQLVHAYDVKNISIENGEVTGLDTSLFATNTTLDNMTIDNVILDGRRVCYGINKNTGWDTPSPIQNPGQFNIRILNSELNAYNDYTTDISMYFNCRINFKNSQYRTTLATQTNLNTTFENCSIDLGNGRFNLEMASGFDIRFLNVKFNYPTNRTQPLFTVKSDNTTTLKFSHVEALIDTNSFCQGGTNIYLYFHDSVINAALTTDTNSKYEELYVTNTKFKTYVLDGVTNKFFTNNIMHLDGSRKDFNIYRTYLDTNENQVRVDLTNQRCSSIIKDDVLVTNDDGMRFTYDIENGRIVVITPNRRPGETFTTFTTIYAYQNR